MRNATWGMRALVLPAQTALTVGRRLRGERKYFRFQQCVACPNFNFPFCDCNDLIDGLTRCIRCNERLTLATDLAKMAQPCEARQDAARRGRPMNIFEIQPSRSLNSSRDRRAPRRIADAFATTVDRRKSSSGATLKAKINHSLKRAKARTGDDISLAAILSESPMDAYNWTSQGLSFSSLSEITRFADVRLPNPGMAGGKYAEGQDAYYNVDGRLAFLWADGDEYIDILTDCFISFQDRFYSVTEIAVIMFAIHRTTDDRFFIMTNTPNERWYATGRTLASILGELVALIRRDLPRSTKRGEFAPNLRMSQSVHVPEGFASLGDRQLSQFLEFTRFRTRALRIRSIRIGLMT